MNLSEAIFRVIDTETTGLDKEDRVCEVAWMDIDAAGAVHGRFSSLIDPGVPIKPGASACHHLVDADVAGQPKLSDLTELIGAGAYVAHNAAFDQKMLGINDGTPFLCTLRLARHVLPEQESYANQVLRYALKLQVDLPKDTAAHRAAADVAVTAALLLHLLPLAREKWPDVTTVQGLIAKARTPVLLQTIRFSKYAGQPYRSIDAGMLRWIINNCQDREDDVYTARTLLASGGRA